MPYVNIKITREGATPEQKARLIHGVTELLVEVLDKSPATTFVVIDEVEMEDWGIGGLPAEEFRRRQKGRARGREAVMVRRVGFDLGLGLRTPLVLAPMAGVSGGALAAAVSRAGGLGLIGGGYCDRDWITRELDAAGGEAVGIGFIGWALADRPEVLDIALERGVRAVFLSFGDIGPFAARVHRAGLPLFVQVQSVEAARAAVAAGADVVVAQGSEAGGHGAQRGTLALVPAVRDVIGTTPLVAAGGIADGRGMAAALMLGADAVLCGTAFYAAHESLAPEAAKRRALAAGGDETVRSVVFDAARGLAWPSGWTLRALRNAFHDRWAAAPGDIGPGERATYGAAAEMGDTDTAAVIVGEAVDLVHAAEPAAQIVARLAREADALLASAPGRLAPAHA